MAHEAAIRKEIEVLISRYLPHISVYGYAPATSGAINEVYKAETNIGPLALRFRHNVHFDYEAIAKEPVILLLLSDSLMDPLALAAAINEIGLGDHSKGTFPVSVPFIPELILFTNPPASSRPFTASRWISSPTLWEVPIENNYSRAGATLALLHSRKLILSGPSLLELTPGGFDIREAVSGVLEKLCASIAKLEADRGVAAERAAANAKHLLACLDRYETVLCHNDFHGGNILVGSSGDMVIDWDNAAFWFPEMDLVKMKYWTVRNNGDASRDVRLNEVFLSAYIEKRGGINETALRISEIVWLLRVIRFELAQMRGEVHSTQNRLRRVTTYLSYLNELNK